MGRVMTGWDFSILFTISYLLHHSSLV
jgi:hypothetical protein